LVIQYISLNVIKNALLWRYSHWRPKKQFNITKLKELFGFGSKILASGIVSSLIENLYSLVIGKVFNASELGYYRRAKSLQEVPSSLIYKVINVVYPSFSKIQEDDVLLKRAFKKANTFVAVINFLVMTLLFVTAEPFVLVVLTPKWQPVIIYLKIFCIAGFIYPLSGLILNAPLIKGRSDHFFYIELAKRVLLLLTIPIAIYFGTVLGFVIAFVIVSFISYFINAHFAGKFIHYSFTEQFNDILPFLVISLLVIVLIGLFNYYFQYNMVIMLILNSFISVFLYLLFSYILKGGVIKEILKIIGEQIKTKQ